MAMWKFIKVGRVKCWLDKDAMEQGSVQMHPGSWDDEQCQDCGHYVLTDEEFSPYLTRRYGQHAVVCGKCEAKYEVEEEPCHICGTHSGPDDTCGNCL